MSDWTKRNFEDIEDRSPAELAMRWLFSRNEVGSEQVGVSRFSYELVGRAARRAAGDPLVRSGH